jgi:hypothetical protein
MLFLLFVRFVPSVALSEVKALGIELRETNAAHREVVRRA